VSPARSSVPTVDPRREISKNMSSWSENHCISHIPAPMKPLVRSLFVRTNSHHKFEVRSSDLRLGGGNEREEATGSKTKFSLSRFRSN
jgi:hypothetical protein